MEQPNMSNVFTKVLSTEEEPMDIYNENSEVGSLYSLNIPFQISMEYCSGVTDADYFTYFTASPKGYYYDVQPAPKSILYYQNRPLHQHNFYELMLVLKGAVTQKIEDKEFFYPVGSCCLINRNLRHAETFTEEACLFFISFSADFMCQLLNSTILFQEEKTLISCEIAQFVDNDLSSNNQKSYLDFFPSLSSKSSEALYKLANALVYTAIFPSFGSTHIIKGILCNLFQLLAQTDDFHITQVNLNSKADFLLYCRIAHILENSDGRISRAELESLFNYTGDYLNRIIKKYTGLSLFDYGMVFCLQKAEYLLLNTDLTIGEIAHKLKFTNRTHFYRLFKEKYKCTPKEYRKKNK